MDEEREQDEKQTPDTLGPKLAEYKRWAWTAFVVFGVWLVSGVLMSADASHISRFFADTAAWLMILSPVVMVISLAAIIVIRAIEKYRSRPLAGS